MPPTTTQSPALHAVLDFHESIVRHAGIADLRPERPLLERLLIVKERGFPFLSTSFGKGCPSSSRSRMTYTPFSPWSVTSARSRNKDRRMRVADRQPNPHNHAGHDEMVFVVELGPESQGAALVHLLVVGEIDDARVRKLIVAFVREADLHRNLVAARCAATSAGFQLALNLQSDLLVDEKIDVHRIEADDRGEHGIVGLDQVSGVDHAAG